MPETTTQQKVRLDPQEQARLSTLFDRHLAQYPDAVVYLFGSRVSPTRKGGDLDLLIVSRQAARNAYALRKQLRIAIKEQLGDQKIDIVICPEPQARGQSAFTRLALQEGVQIWP